MLKLILNYFVDTRDFGLDARHLSLDKLNVKIIILFLLVYQVRELTYVKLALASKKFFSVLLV